MTPAEVPVQLTLGRHEEHLEAHDRALDEIRDQAKEDRAEVRGLKNWIMATLATALLGLIAQLLLKR